MHKFFYSMVALNALAVLINLPFLGEPLNFCLVLLNIVFGLMNYVFAKDAKNSIEEWS
jgi:hypothetical protein